MSFCEVSQIIVRLIEAKLFQPFHAYIFISLTAVAPLVSLKTLDNLMAAKV